MIKPTLNDTFIKSALASGAIIPPVDGVSRPGAGLWRFAFWASLLLAACTGGVWYGLHMP
jgi:hypothetical protein